MYNTKHLFNTLYIIKIEEIFGYQTSYIYKTQWFLNILHYKRIYVHELKIHVYMVHSLCLTFTLFKQKKDSSITQDFQNL